MISTLKQITNLEPSVFKQFYQPQRMPDNFTETFISENEFSGIGNEMKAESVTRARKVYISQNLPSMNTRFINRKKVH